MTNRWRYDNAGRPVAVVAADGMVDSTQFDEAGNPVTIVTRRYVAGQPSSVQPITIEYDLLNRPIKRIIPGFVYSARNEGIPTWLSGSSPYPAYAIAADTLRYTYTPDGHLDSATNRYAQVARTYSNQGRLLTETLRIANVAANDLTQHSYLTQYRYDRNGRRAVIKVPSQLVTANRDSIRLTYTNWGSLEHVHDLFGNDLSYTYDVRSQVTQLNRASATILQKWSSDADGRVLSDTVDNNGGTTFPRWSFTRLRAATQRYDGRDRVLLRADPLASSDTLTASYSGLGYLTSSHYVQKGTVTAYGTAVTSISNEGPTYDPLGNITGGEYRDTVRLNGIVQSASLATRNVTYKVNVGRDTVDSFGAGTRFLNYDAAGNMAFSTMVGQTGKPSEDRASFYDAAGQLVAADWRWVAQAFTESGGQKAAFEEYRYDALGRRVWTRTQRTCADVLDDKFPLMSGGLSIECRLSFVRRTVWDGDQELAEINAPGGASESAKWEQDTGYYSLNRFDFKDPNPYYGRVVYAYGLDIDQPVSIARYGYMDYPNGGAQTQWLAFAILPLWDLTGRPATGTFGDGAAVKQLQSGGGACATPDTNNVLRCVLLYWPYSWSAYDQRKGIRMQSWHGSLLEDKRDHAGTSYRRNRVYDPTTGRFSQEDPIGLAGGVNLYGFERGDPVNFNDPFGLFPCCRALDLGPMIGSAVREQLAAREQEIRQHMVFGLHDLLLAHGFGTIIGGIGTGATEGAVDELSAAGSLARAASRGAGNFGIGVATAEESIAAGRAWVGSGARLARDGSTLVSRDGLRQFRPPTFKPRVGRVQANLESRSVPRGPWQNNAHIDVLQQQRRYP